ncbi:FtsQ-type POTRA domain-containing protein [Robertmurraya massiliosenegalensis]|uniref:cell division protein FtsQ/DivIB n=1 Tax=Robertmurraya TaxID=2837507 RepID=UPI0039A75FB2
MEKGKIVSLEDRVPKLKQQRRRKANKRLIFLLFLFFLLISCVVYFQSPLSHVNIIKIIGNEAYVEDELIALSGLTKNTNVWKINENEVVEKLEELTEVKSATVEVEFPNNVAITLKEWKRIAYIMKDGLFLPILENGNILEEQSGTIPVNSPILFSFSEGNAMEAMIDELNNIPVEVLNSISEIHLDPKETDPYHIKLFMNDGFEVSASIRSFSDKMAHYPSIVSQLDPEIKGVIDLEVGSFFKAYEWEGAEEENETEGEG